MHIDALSDGGVHSITTEHQEIDKDHGRIETRRCIASSALTDWQPEPDLWPGLRTVAMVESTREIGDAVATQRRYYVSSLPPDAARVAHAVRSHWTIENGMQRTPDVAFNEDLCRARVEHAAQNFAILRRIALNLLRQDRTSKASLKNRRMLACANDRYLVRILGWDSGAPASNVNAL